MRLRRSPLLFWIAAVAVAALTASTVARSLGDASARAARLGGLRAVTVTARPVDAGDIVSAGDVTVRDLPAALLPAGSPARSPRGRVALVDLAAGEVLLEARLAPAGVEGVAALLPEGMRGVAVPVDSGGLAVRRGNRVDVLATFDTVEGVGGEPTFAVATDALVLDVAEEAVTVAVAPDEAPRVAFAIARGTVTLALTSPE